MKRLLGISVRFLRNSKVLTLSCIISICTATILIVLLSNYSISMKEGYKQNLRETYGDYDMILTYSDYMDMGDSLVENVKAMDGIEDVAIGRTSNFLEIDGNYVYGLGVVDSEMIKSRYHYVNHIQENQVVINQVLADVLQTNVGKLLYLSDMPIEVIEIIEDSALSSSRVPMAIMDMDTLTRITRESNYPNFMLLKLKESAKSSAVDRKLFLLDPSLKITILEQDDFYKRTISSYDIYITVLISSVLVVTVLFLSSVFRGYIYKYQHNMAIMRAIGGKKKQVGIIYLLIGSIPSGIGCITGYFISVALHHTLLQLIYNDLFFRDITVGFYYVRSAMISILIFSVILLILYMSVRKIEKILPIQALYQNEVMMAGKNKGMRNRLSQKILFIGKRIMPKDIYISIRLLLSKMKENKLIIGTIIMLVVISFVGSSLSTIIKYNNSKYLKNQYLTEIVAITNGLITYNDSMDIYERLKGADGIQTSIVLSSGTNMKIGDREVSYALADIVGMEKQLIITNATHNKNRMIVSDALAKELNIKIGDTLTTYTPAIFERDDYGNAIGIIKNPVKYDLIVTDVVPRESLENFDVYVDMGLDDFRREFISMKNIYLSGNLELGKELLSEIKNEHPNIIWSSYQDMVEKSDQLMDERYEIFQLVTYFLILIAGVGWFNSMRNIIISRRKDYHMMRIQGVVPRRMFKIISYQILFYLFIGICIGSIFGYVILHGILMLDGGGSNININWEVTRNIIIYLLILGGMLSPLLYKVSREKIIIS